MACGFLCLLAAALSARLAVAFAAGCDAALAAIEGVVSPAAAVPAGHAWVAGPAGGGWRAGMQFCLAVVIWLRRDLLSGRTTWATLAAGWIAVGLAGAGWLDASGQRRGLRVRGHGDGPRLRDRRHVADGPVPGLRRRSPGSPAAASGALVGGALERGDHADRHPGRLACRRRSLQCAVPELLARFRCRRDPRARRVPGHVNPRPWPTCWRRPGSPWRAGADGPGGRFVRDRSALPSRESCIRPWRGAAASCAMRPHRQRVEPRVWRSRRPAAGSC